jgi:hypothetical protein
MFEALCTLSFAEVVLKNLSDSKARVSVAYPGILFGGGGSTNSVEDRGQRDGDLGAVRS